uniref:Uncharacterized protein n=1 Tax=Oryza punctata TaxID=4537 RepID=A0A0E0LGI5_ORYPU
MVKVVITLSTFLSLKKEKNDLVAYAISLGNEHRLTSCSISSSSMTRSEESMTKGYLLDTSRAASILMRAISSLSRSSSSPDFRLCLSMRKVEILFTSLMTTEATSSVFIHHNVLDDCLCLLVKVEGKRFACKKVPDKRVEEQVTTRCPS